MEWTEKFCVHVDGTFVLVVFVPFHSERTVSTELINMHMTFDP